MSRSSSPRHGRLLRLAVAGAAAAVLLAQALAVVLLTTRAHQAAIEAGQAGVERMARSVEGAINRSFVQVDATLLGLPRLLARLTREGALDGAAASAVLREVTNQNMAIRDLLLVRADGLPLATALSVSRRRPLPLPLGGGYHDAGLPGGGLTIGGPFRNPVTGEWSLFFARRITLPDGEAVSAVAEMPLLVITGLLGTAGDTPGLRVLLERRDGTLLAAMPHDEARLGRPLAPGEGPPRPGLSRIDGAPVLAAERPTLYPVLSVVVTLDREDALAAWRQDRNGAVLVSVALGLMVLALAGALLLVLGQRARADEERQRWRRTLENALDSMTDGFVMFDHEDRLVAFNQRYRELYALSAAAIREGALFDDIMREGLARGQYPQFQGGDPEAFIAELKAWRRTGGPAIERLLPDGRWVLIAERPTPEGGTVGIRTDITELKHAMAAIEQAAAAKTMFLARMSHELRTPLNAILGFAQLLLSDRRIAPDQYEQLRLLHEAGAHLRELVNGLLDLAKIDAGKLDLHAEPLALGTLIEGCMGFLAPDARRKRIALELERAPGLPAAVRGDATRLRQMLLNLLSNAVKFTPVGGRVELRVKPLAPGLRFEVQDSGPGVPADRRHLLFQDFTQLGAVGDPESPGTGLGLAITARLAAMMGGRIGVESEPGQGACFWLELPLAAAELPAAPAAGEGPALRPLRLLVADDILPNRLLMRAMLSAAGHSVTLAADGAEALRLVESESFDAVLLDVRMPGMDGLEAARRLRAMPAPLCRLPVIAVTASALSEEIAECADAGMDAHVAKPVDRDTLFALLARLTGGAARADAA